MIRQGQVRVAGSVVSKPAASVDPDGPVELTTDPATVGRGSAKLAGALDIWGISPRGVVALDAGACTGGFTEVLLARGAARVYAVDVGHDQLAASLRRDPRVVDMPGVNLRTVVPGWLGEQCGLVVADVSFISLTLVLPALVAAATADADFVLLVKPQFEAGRAALDGTGVVRSAEDRAGAVARVVTAAQELDLAACAVAPSVIVGGRGNQEYFLHLRGGSDHAAMPLSQVFDTVLKDGDVDRGRKDRR